MKTKPKTSARRSKGKRATKSARVDIRLTVRQREILERASGILGKSLSGYVADSAVAAAYEEIERERRIELNAEQSRLLADALLNPRGPSEELIDAARDYKAGRRRAGF
jgi:uncharacterized protein (DUF1778 family)